MFKLIFAGTGGAFAPLRPATKAVLAAREFIEKCNKLEAIPILKNLDADLDPYGKGHSNMLIEKDGEYLLIDAGGDARHTLSQLGIPLSKITAAYCSHTHGDHAYGFEWYMLLKYFLEINQGKARPLLFGASDVIDRLWEQALSASLETIENTREATLTSFVEVRAFDPKNPQPFIWKDIEFQPIQTVHVMSGRKLQPSWGLLIQERVDLLPLGTPPRKKIFITTDTQFAPYQLKRFYDEADVIFHDCETLPFKSGVHAHFEDLKASLNKATKNKMWLYHNQPNPPHEEAKAAGFQGFVAAGQVFEF